jgi:SOS-response transcriptional repressor LexA
MKIDDYFNARISMARQAVNLTQGELAEKVGVVRRQIAAYEAGDSKPRDKVLANLAAALGTTAEWLSSGKGNAPELGNIRRTVTLPEIPLYTEYDFISTSTPFYDQNRHVVAKPSGYIVAPSCASESAFAIKLMGDSMHSISSPSFPSGSVITFEPATRASNNDFVLYGYEGNKFTFKQLIIDQSVEYLCPLNFNYQRWANHDEEFKVLGVAIHSQLDIRRAPPLTEMDYFEHLLWKQKERETRNTPIFMDKNDIEGRLDKLESMLEQLLKK